MPEVTVKVSASPSGLPTARTQLPTRASSLLPSEAGVSPVASILRTATSVFGSVPTTLATNSRWSSSRTVTCWRLVDDVIVGQDVPVSRDDEAGAAPLLDLGPRMRRGGRTAPSPAAPAGLGPLGPLRLDVHDAGLDVLGDVGERLAQVRRAWPPALEGTGAWTGAMAEASVRSWAGRAGGEIEQPGEEQAHREGQGDQSTELEPIERARGHRDSLISGRCLSI